MKTGIIGARGAGKSTVFHALTGLAAIAGGADPRNRARPGQIKIADPRLDFLERTYGSRKKVAVELALIDFAPNLEQQKAGAALDLSLLPLLRDLDAILIVIAQFGGLEIELAAALQSVESELVFADFEQAERRLERLKKEKADSDFERATLEKCVASLESGSALRTLRLTAQELAAVSGFRFLSLKPALIAINCDIERAAAELSDSDQAALRSHRLEVFRLAASFEAELWDLDEPAQVGLLEEAGLSAPARDRLIAALYAHLGLITFYTAGEPEAHAWPLAKGATALEAAARIHTDIARGFIRAEVMGYDDFAALGSEARVKEAGKFRLEGRDYLMRDGDIIHIRFKI